MNIVKHNPTYGKCGGQLIPKIRGTRYTTCFCLGCERMVAVLNHRFKREGKRWGN